MVRVTRGAELALMLITSTAIPGIRIALLHGYKTRDFRSSLHFLA